MATKKFLFQGVTNETHGAAVRDLFDVDDVQSVVISVAFVNEGGVEHIEEGIKPYAKITRVFAGVRNEITSVQGLERLWSLIGNGLHTVDTGSRLIIFHPKFFLVRGSERARMIIGSANLTLGGLNNNIEASVVLNLNLEKEQDRTFIESVESQLAGMVDDYPENVTAIEEKDVLQKMLASGRLINEDSLPPPRPRTSVKDGGVEDITPCIKLKVPRIRRPASDVDKPAVSKPKGPIQDGVKSSAKTSKAAEITAAPSIGVAYDLLWESKLLTRRDLGIPTAQNTHATGSINLDKGLLAEEVDHRHYFRDKVFSALSWMPKNSTVIF